MLVEYRILLTILNQILVYNDQFNQIYSEFQTDASAERKYVKILLNTPNTEYKNNIQHILQINVLTWIKVIVSKVRPIGYYLCLASVG